MPICPLKQLTYHWGHKDYLPNLYSRRIILGNSMYFGVRKITSKGTNTELLDKNYLT